MARILIEANQNSVSPKIATATRFSSRMTIKCKLLSRNLKPHVPARTIVIQTTVGTALVQYSRTTAAAVASAPGIIVYAILVGQAVRGTASQSWVSHFLTSSSILINRVISLVNAIALIAEIRVEVPVAKAKLLSTNRSTRYGTVRDLIGM